MPLGVGLALAGVRFSRALAVLVLYTLTVEVLQLSAVAGRDASLGDLLMNSLGGAAGYALGARVHDLLHPHPVGAATLSAAATALFLVVQLVAGYSVVPAPTRSIYFGQIAQPYGPLPERFSGRVPRAFIGGDQPLAIPNGRFADSRRPHDLLRDPAGVTFQVTVVGGDSVGYAPIARIVDDEQRELAVLAQSRRDVVVGIRTGANVLRLQPMRFRLRNVFASQRPGDTLHIDARVAGGNAEFVLRGDRTLRHTRQRPVSSAWRLLYPWQLRDRGAVRDVLAGVAWLALLAFPAAYYLTMATTGRARRMALVGSHLLVVVTASWLVLAPFPARFVWWEWLALLGGYLAGAWTAWRAVPRSRITLPS